MAPILAPKKTSSDYMVYENIIPTFFWGRIATAIYRIIILYHTIISHYHIRVKLLQGKVMAPPV